MVKDKEKLEDLRKIRNDADYDLEDGKFICKETCFMQFALATSSYNKLLSINRSDLKKRLVAYAKRVNKF